MDRKEKLESICRDLLETLGEDVSRDGLLGTPDRWARMWLEFIDYDPGKTDTTFEQIVSDQMIIISPVRVWSLCEHHLLPFWCDIAIGYIPQESIIGLSKLARIAHKYAHALQVQERLVQQIANEVMDTVGSQDVAVMAKGEHLCMTMRGIRSDGRMVSSIMSGVFRSESSARMEFLQTVKWANS